MTISWRGTKSSKFYRVQETIIPAQPCLFSREHAPAHESEQMQTVWTWRANRTAGLGYGKQTRPVICVNFLLACPFPFHFYLSSSWRPTVPLPPLHNIYLFIFFFSSFYIWKFPVNQSTKKKRILSSRPRNASVYVRTRLGEPGRPREGIPPISCLSSDGKLGSWAVLSIYWSNGEEWISTDHHTIVFFLKSDFQKFN